MPPRSPALNTSKAGGAESPLRCAESGSGGLRRGKRRLGWFPGRPARCRGGRTVASQNPIAPARGGPESRPAAPPAGTAAGRPSPPGSRTGHRRRISPRRLPHQSVSHEGVGALSSRYTFRDAVGQDEEWTAGERSVSGPPGRDVLGSPTGDDRPGVLDHLFKDLCAAAGKAIGRHGHAPARGHLMIAAGSVTIELPVEEPHTSLTQRLLGCVVRVSDESIQRYVNANDYRGHEGSLLPRSFSPRQSLRISALL